MRLGESNQFIQFYRRLWSSHSQQTFWTTFNCSFKVFLTLLCAGVGQMKYYKLLQLQKAVWLNSAIFVNLYNLHPEWKSRQDAKNFPSWVLAGGLPLDFLFLHQTTGLWKTVRLSPAVAEGENWSHCPLFLWELKLLRVLGLSKQLRQKSRSFSKTSVLFSKNYTFK